MPVWMEGEGLDVAPAGKPGHCVVYGVPVWIEGEKVGYYTSR